jgi:hypothetical protein
LLHLTNYAISSTFTNRANLETLTTFCMDETNKITTTYKTIEEFNQRIQAEPYNLLPDILINHTTNWMSVYANPEKSLREKIEAVGSMIEEYVSDRDDRIPFITTSTLTTFILKALSLLRIYPSHFIILTELNSAYSTSTVSAGQKTLEEPSSRWMESSGVGLRSLLKIVSLLSEISFVSMEHETMSTFLHNTLNIIKIGGKID